MYNKINILLFQRPQNLKTTKSFLLYIFNDVCSTGKLDDVIYKVKHQPKAKPFDYNYNTQEGNN